MSALTIQLPESLHRSIQALIEREGISWDQFQATAAAEKMSAMLSAEYIRRHAATVPREDFERYLAAAGDEEPMETDRSFH